MSAYLPNRPVTIRCGKLTVAAGGPEQAAPGNAATITIYESLLDWNGLGAQPPAVPFSRLMLSILSSHDSGASGLVFSQTLDGVNYDSITTYTYSAAGGEATYDFLIRSGANVKVVYTNSANNLTAWRYRLEGVFDRAVGGLTSATYNLSP